MGCDAVIRDRAGLSFVRAEKIPCRNVSFSDAASHRPNVSFNKHNIWIQYLKMENGVKVNGFHGSNGSSNGTDEDSRPRTPSLNTLSLTEYSTNPSPPSSTPKPNLRSVVPDDFMLPNGYPDVWLLN